MSTVAKLLATRGVWVEQLTTLDPHPVFPGDEPAKYVWDNVLFADNYWRAGAGGFDGEVVYGARNVNLEGVIYNPISILGPDHVAVHAYYHGTIDQNALRVDGVDIPTAWYDVTKGTGPRNGIGFYFARNGSANDKGVDARSLGDGLHQDLTLQSSVGGARWGVALDGVVFGDLLGLAPAH